MDEQKLRAGLLMISRGFKMCADAIPDAGLDGMTEEQCEVEFTREWGERGLTRAEARKLCARWGFQPQKIGAHIRGGWIEMRGDLRYLTAKSHDWLAERA